MLLVTGVCEGGVCCVFRAALFTKFMRCVVNQSVRVSTIRLLECNQSLRAFFVAQRHSPCSKEAFDAMERAVAAFFTPCRWVGLHD